MTEPNAYELAWQEKSMTREKLIEEARETAQRLHERTGLDRDAPYEAKVLRSCADALEATREEGSEPDQRYRFDADNETYICLSCGRCAPSIDRVTHKDSCAFAPAPKEGERFSVELLTEHLSDPSAPDGVYIVRSSTEGCLVFEEHAQRIASALSRVKAHREALKDLEDAERFYRKQHDLHGDGSPKAGRAWDLMKRAGDHARAVLKEDEGVGQSQVSRIKRAETWRHITESLETDHG